MKTTISTLIAFSVLGLVAPPAGALNSKSFHEQRDPRAPYTERQALGGSLVPFRLHP